MNYSKSILSDIVTFSKYARYNQEKGRREIWKEIVDRNMEMHLKKFPKISNEIQRIYKDVYARKALPSLRSLQFGGEAIEKMNSRMFNCCFVNADDILVFPEIMYMLMGGTGVGYSVRKHHIAKLPFIHKVTAEKEFIIEDSLIGWCDSVKALIFSYYNKGPKPIFNYSLIRPKGALLKTSGGRAPGFQPLKLALERIQQILDSKTNGEKLSSLEVHDIICHIANCVVSGGIRRSALICLFSKDDTDLLNCKSNFPIQGFEKIRTLEPNSLYRVKANNKTYEIYLDPVTVTSILKTNTIAWYLVEEQRGRANNSVSLVRGKVTKDEFVTILRACEASNAGEPGIFWTNDEEEHTGLNPCQPAFAPLIIKGKGLSTMGDLVEGDEIWDGFKWTKVLKKWSTGVKKVNAYKTLHGIFYGTTNHRIVQAGSKIEVEKARHIDYLRGVNDITVFDDLSVGSLMFVFYKQFGKHTHEGYNLSIPNGLLDQHIYFNPLKDYLNTYSKSISNVDNRTHYLIDTTLISDFEKELSLNDNYNLISLVKGLLLTSIQIKKEGMLVVLLDQDLTILVQLVLNSYGVLTEYKTLTENNRTYYALLIKDYDSISNYVNYIGILDKDKENFDLNNYSKLSSDSLPSPIIEIFDCGEMEVFDITVDNDTHTYYTGGCNVSNCVETALNSGQCCNVTTQNAEECTSQAELNRISKSSSFIGTLQAAYTDFGDYLRPLWREITEEQALLGCSITGIGSGVIEKFSKKEAALGIVDENQKLAKKIGINPSARTTLIKPEGTSSLLLGTSSGIHGHYAAYYLRRIRLNKEEPIYKFLRLNIPDLLEDDFFNPADGVLTIPIEAPKDGIFRTETALDTLNRIKHYAIDWIIPGHVYGIDKHNVSCTVNVRKDENINEWDDVIEWMWENREYYTGIALLPYDNGNYIQAPLEECDKETYHKLLEKCKSVNFSNLNETVDITNIESTVACAGGACEIISI